jgi:AbrB family looped-hinge helix DNA binding protein
MPAKFRVKLTKIGDSLRMTIPRPAVDGLGWSEGDVLSLTVTDHEITIKRATGKD